jgi:bacterioferritin-associated ferredoxin
LTQHPALGILTTVMVCHCAAVNDTAIRSEIEAGVADATTLAERCGAGAGCGSCHDVVDALLRQFALDPEPVPA